MLRQTTAIIAMNLRSIPQRLGASLVIVVGIAGVVAVLVAMLSMSAGLSRTLTATGSEQRAVVLRGGANIELSSFLERNATTLVKMDPAVARDPNGLPMASAEIIVVTELRRAGQGMPANVSLRGVEPAGFSIRPELAIIEGRRFRPALREVIVGRGAQQEFEGLAVGGNVRIRGADWRVVGVFEAGDAHDSELWADIGSVQSGFSRSGYSSVLAELTHVDAFGAFEARLTSDPQLNVDVFREPDYFGAQSANITRQIGFLTGIIAAIMAAGALFGALNTMYAAVSSRTVEIGTLRALGFGRVPVVASVMAESLLLSLLGGLLGAALAFALFNGYQVSTLGSGFSQVAFNFAVTPALLLQGLAWALGIGFFGGLMPALRAARIPVTDALRGG
jgi:putative ABC transport system permease protein